MKHNNVLPNAHFKKQWQRRVKVTLDQPAKALRRRLKRKEKQKKIFPRPLDRLKPIVQCQTQRYNMKQRLGRGFTPLELKTAGVAVLYAPTIGIAVDMRRKNKSQESLDRNVSRLKEYMTKLVVFKKKSSSTPKINEEIRSVVNVPEAKTDAVEYAEVTKEMQGFKARQELRRQKAVSLKERREKCHKYGKEDEDK